MAVHPEPFAYLIDGCTGSGMLGLAVKVALGGLGGDGGGIRTILNIEREANTAATLVARMEETTLDKSAVWDVIEYADCPEVVEYLRRFRDRPLIFTAGYPCQGFSLAGKRRGEEDERFIWPYIDAFIGAGRPDVVFLENVANHLALGFARVRRDLESRGYRVTRGLFTAKEVGAGHKRERLFILAKLGDTGHGTECNEQWGECEMSASITRQSSQDVAHTDGQRKRESEHETFAKPRKRTRKIAGGHSRNMADTKRGQPEQPEGCFGEIGGWDRDGGEELANTGCERCEGAERPGTLSTGRNAEPHGATCQCSIPLFAPGPGELEEWARNLQIDPDLEPALCRVPDGYAAGMDASRLRITGNGVVPLQAAYAFVTLWAALEYGGGF